MVQYVVPDLVASEIETMAGLMVRDAVTAQ
ncbi:hypothetical protein ACVMIH_006801 [Bradyrhizobium sp. USDA 4503]